MQAKPRYGYQSRSSSYLFVYVVGNLAANQATRFRDDEEHFCHIWTMVASTVISPPVSHSQHDAGTPIIQYKYHSSCFRTVLKHSSNQEQSCNVIAFAELNEDVDDSSVYGYLRPLLTNA